LKRFIYFFTVTICLLTLGIYGYLATKNYQNGKKNYSNYGQKIPENYELLGIDVSSYQGIINWPKALATKHKNQSIQFVFLKASQGSAWIDPMYFRNIYQLRKTQIPVGHYHFFNPNKSALAQAKLFCRVIQYKKGDLPPVLDIEGLEPQNSTKLVKNLKIWLKYTQEKTHVTPMLYTNAYYYERFLKGHFNQYHLWIAQYSTKPSSPKTVRNWAFWQFSQTGTVNGINAKVDLNVYAGSRRSFLKLLR
jgi:lysozyme